MNALSFPRKTSSRRGLLRARATLSVLGALLIFGLAAGCAHAPVNQPLTVRDQDRGYRFSTTPPKAPNTDEVFIILALSGGGTRAAAFSYGAMEKLAATTFTHDGVKRSLLDEVDVISSVSGGSFTAAYYGLHRDPAAFAQFPARFLYPKIRTGLALSLFNPVNWPRLVSPYYSRIDLAADYYDRHVFDHKTFGDLAAIGRRPFIVLNATDMSLSSRFEFTQDQFDLISSDLSSYPVARGVAASSAFPLLLSPLTLRNYPGATETNWMQSALKDRARNPRDYAYAQAMESYLDAGQRPFIHLLDGGLSDNVGLRGPAYALFSSKNLWSHDVTTGRSSSLMQLLNTRKIRSLVVITVNAKTVGRPEYDRDERPPGLLSVLSTVTTGPMGNYSDETVQYVRDQLEAMRQLMDGPDAADEIKFYPMELTFQNVASPSERAYLNGIATDFQIPREAVDRLRAAAGRLLEEAPAFHRLLQDLAAAPDAR
jgi:NTE family protein